MYEIKKTVEYRARDKYIILVTLKSFIEKNSFIDPEILLGSYKFMWGKVMSYFFDQLQCGLRRERDGLPFHYGVELIDKDYCILTGQPVTNGSYWMRKLAEKSVIPYEYKDSVVICMFEDFTVDNPDIRMIEHMAHQLITPMMNYLDIPRSRVKMIDEIVDWDLLNQLVRNDEILYNRLTPSTWWDSSVLQFKLSEFKKRGNH
jgi:hypothetical protein